MWSEWLSRNQSASSLFRDRLESQPEAESSPPQKMWDGDLSHWRARRFFPCREELRVDPERPNASAFNRPLPGITCLEPVQQTRVIVTGIVHPPAHRTPVVVGLSIGQYPLELGFRCPRIEPGVVVLGTDTDGLTWM